MVQAKEQSTKWYQVGIMESEEFPNIPEQLLPHFVRGVLDSKGWIDDEGYVVCIRCHTKSFAKKLQQVLYSWGVFATVRDDILPSGMSIYRIRVTGNRNIQKLQDIMIESSKKLKHMKLFIMKN